MQGSKLWQKLVKAGKLSGSDAQKPKEVDIIQVALIVLRLAENKGEKELIAWWYAVLPYEIFYYLDKKRLVKSDPLLCQILAIALSNNAPQMKTDYGCLRYPKKEDIAEVSDSKLRDFLTWWFQPVWEAVQG